MLILPLSALVARRVPLGQTLKLAAIWAALFAVAAVIVTQIDRFRTGGGSDPSVLSGGATRIARAEDGHYWATAQINGHERRMLIDSGATTTVLSAATAEAAGIDIEESTFPRLVETANGQVMVRTAHVARLGIGTIEARDLPVVVSEAQGDQNIIGMNFLSRLQSWRVEGNELILTP
jgi:aspartyl protease family protein